MRCEINVALCGRMHMQSPVPVVPNVWAGVGDWRCRTDGGGGWNCGGGSAGDLHLI